MRRTSFKEQDALKRLVARDQLTQNLERADLLEYPIVVDVPAGEDSGVGYPGEDLRAPATPGLYTLWHAYAGGEHFYWRWTRQES